MKRMLLCTLAAGLLGCSSGGDDDPSGGTPPTVEAPEASALFVLGDSLSDVGNAAALVDYLVGQPMEPPTVGLCNPIDIAIDRPCDDLFYEQSRVSNGPVAAEYLAEELGVELGPSLHLIPSRPEGGTNYAVASAKARGDAPQDLVRQIDGLLLNEAALDPDAIYLVMIGGNDAVDALQAAADDLANAETLATPIVAAAVDAIGAGVERLLDFGARRIVVANVPDLAIIAGVLAEAGDREDEAAVLATARAVTVAFNTRLAARLAEIEAADRWPAPEPDLLMFDLASAWQAAADELASDGGNATEACFDSELYRDSDRAERVFHPDCAPADDGPPGFGAFLYWDSIHPTGAAHAAVGAALIESVAAAF